MKPMVDQAKHEALNQKVCPLCVSTGGDLLVQAEHFRVVRATDQPLFPLTYRIIWNAHVAEFSDLNQHERHLCDDALAWLEAAMRRFLTPDKMNLAELGNVVPHLHWHVIARYHWDSTFPASVWAPAVRTVDDARWQALGQAQQMLEIYLVENIHQVS